MADVAARGSAKARLVVQPLTGVPSEATDPSAAQPAASLWRRASQASVIGIFIILLFFALDLARAFMVPVTAAFVIGMILGPVASRAARYRIPTVITAIALWLLVVAFFYTVIALLSGPALDWIARAPDIAGKIQDRLHAIEQPLTNWPFLRNAIRPNDGGLGAGLDIADLLKSTAIIVTPALGQIVIFFATLFFILLGRTQLRNGLIASFRDRESRLRAIRIINEVERNLTGYLGLVTVINLFVGAAAGLIASFVGLPNPAAWGVLGFLLNYIPYVGALMLELALLAAGLATFPTLSYAFLAPLLFLAVATMEGQFITPSIIGRRFPLNPLAVFLSVVFWTWLWGPMGTFLAVPLVVTGLAVVEHVIADDEPELPG
jgi:predicted PurR-regulated permease PerM